MPNVTFADIFFHGHNEWPFAVGGPARRLG